MGALIVPELHLNKTDLKNIFKTNLLVHFLWQKYLQ